MGFQTILKCSYCNISFIKNRSSLLNSKSGLYFCCRQHKDKAQELESNFPEIRPLHYKNGRWSYRKKAFKHYRAKCFSCGYNKNKKILEVHHIDCNRENNKLENLIILCPNCHRIKTMGL